MAQRTPDRFDRQMKKAAVPTTAARGAAVSNRRRTAVQSVYIPKGENGLHHPSPWDQRAEGAATSRFTGCRGRGAGE